MGMSEEITKNRASHKSRQGKGSNQGTGASRKGRRVGIADSPVMKQICIPTIQEASTSGRLNIPALAGPPTGP